MHDNVLLGLSCFAHVMLAVTGFSQHYPFAFLGACLLIGTTARGDAAKSGSCSHTQSCLASFPAPK